jgi:hypothetical protein
MLGFKNKINKKPQEVNSKNSKEKQNKFFIQNKSSFPEDSNPQVSKVTLEKVWNLKNIQIALFIGFILLILSIGLLILTNANLQLALIILLICVIIYAIILYFLLNPQTQKTVEKDKIRNVERQTLKVVEKPIFKPILKVVEKPKEIIKIVERPVIRKVSRPITVPVNENLMENYPYVASTKSKKIHHTSSTAGRMIKPENREFAHKITNLKKKGYTEGQVKPKK